MQNINLGTARLAIDDDVLAAAKHLAEREHKNVGEVLYFLAGQGLARAIPPWSARPLKMDPESWDIGGGPRSEATRSRVVSASPA